MASRQQLRYGALRAAHFTPYEAREFSKLPSRTPALKAMVRERQERRDRFERIASRKLEQGKWRRQDLQQKWLNNLSRMYSRKGLRVQHGPTGKQQPMKKYTPNPWALYRKHLKDAPDKPGYESPWKKRKRGVSLLSPSGFLDYSEVEKMQERKQQRRKR